MNEVRPARGIGVAILLGTALVIGFLLLVRPGSTTYSVNGISLDVPADWVIHDNLPPTTGMGQVYALVGTLPWGPCSDNDINCHYGERLDHHQIEVGVGVLSLLADDFCAFAKARPDLEPRSDGIRVSETHYVRIDGRPAIWTAWSLDSPDYYLSDGWREWRIAPVGSTTSIYVLSAKWRGPGDDQLLAELDQLISSIKVTASGYAQPNVPDCGEPFPAA